VLLKSLPQHAADYRPTPHYKFAASDVDRWDTFDWTFTEARVGDERDYFDDGSQRVYYAIQLSRDDVPHAEIRQVLRDRYGADCCCEHACCGHLFGGLTELYQEHAEPNKWIAVAQYSPNY